jgi:hypothetical protein
MKFSMIGQGKGDIDSLHKFLLYILYTITNRKIAFSGTKFHNPYMVFTTDVFIKFVFEVFRECHAPSMLKVKR